MNTNIYEFPFEQDNDWGFFVDLETADYETSYCENTETDTCELFNGIKNKIEYLTSQICISGVFIYNFFNTSKVSFNNIH